MDYHVLVLAVAMISILPLGGSAELCGWEERLNIALEELVAPARVLREYSDLRTPQECYARCCAKEKAGCNVAAFLSYDGEAICLNIRCQPFRHCVWGPSPDNSVAAVITSRGRANNASSNSIASERGNSTVAPSPTTDTTSPPSVTNFGLTSTDGDNRTLSTSESTATMAHHGLTTATSAEPKSEFKQRPSYSAKDFNVRLPNSETEGNERHSIETTTYTSYHEHRRNQSQSTVTNSKSGETQHVHYAISIVIGLGTFVSFLIIMFVAARRFNLFKADKSHYRPLLDVHDAYSETYSTSDFEQ